MRRLHLALISLFFATSAASAQEVLHMSLAECTEYALRHNYNIKNAKLDVMIQDVQNKQTLSASYPHINAKADFNDFYVPQKSFIDVSGFNPSAPRGYIAPVAFTVPYGASAGFTASQLLFDGAVFVAWKARNTVMELARQNANVTEEGVRYNVYKAYNSLIIAYRQYEVIKSSLGYARSLEHDLEVTRQNGFAEKIDVERTTVQVNNLAADSMRVGNFLKVSEDVLKYQMGMSMDTRIILTDTALDQRKAEALSLLNEEASYDRIPEYRLVNTSMKLNEYNLKRYRYSALPSISAYWQYGDNYGTDNIEHIFNKLYKYEPYSTIGLSISMPLYNGSLRMNQVRETKLNIEKSRNSIENMKQTIDFQVVTGRSNLKNAMLQVQSQHRNMDLANDVLDLAQKKYKAGVGSNLEVTQAQTDQLRAETGYFSALLDVINAEADLKKALGLLK